MKRTLVILAAFWCAVMPGMAQNDTDDMDGFAEDFESFRKAIHKDFEDFRKKCNEEYAAFLKNPWAEFKEEAPKPRPKEEPVPPVIRPEDNRDEPTPQPRPLPFDTVVTAPKPTPQPKPVEPVKEKPEPIPIPRLQFSLFGTGMAARFQPSAVSRLRSTSERDVAEAWQSLADNGSNNLVYDCLELRRKHRLGDWAYLELLQAVAEKAYGKDTDEATLLMAYLYCQSGYKMRLARDGNNRLHMLFASRHAIYDISYYILDGERFYPYGECPSRIYISDVAFRGEQSLSLLITESPDIALASTATVTRQSSRYPDVKVTLSSNKNLMDFYSSYPTSMIGDNPVSRWAMYANTPMSKDVRQQIYPALRASIQGCDELTAVNRLLDFVQTGFIYEYDDKVWGGDRAFFAEESLYYPYCDCEDRSILFTRLVRDLLGLRCILIYYPGHLASAVELKQTQNAKGDYILLNNRRFIVADATYIGAPAGLTMPNMDNRTAQVILLE